MRAARRSAISSAAAAIIVVILVLGVVSVVYVNSTQETADELRSQSLREASLQSQVQSLANRVEQGGYSGNITLPVMNQTPTIRSIRETWYLSPSAHQDRFDPSFIVVNQGDNVSLTFIDNDTVAHDFVIVEPGEYNIVVNATVPGLVNDLTGQKFTGPATNNSPGVVVRGTPGNVSAKYSFTAKYPGIFEFVCTYHAEVGMIGYLVVLPNAAYVNQTTTTSSTGGMTSVSILPGASMDTTSKGYGPDSITVVIGINNTIVWTNNDSSPHTVTQDGGGFDSGNMAPGAIFTHTFTVGGVYHYHCAYHSWMTGTVIVRAAS